MTGCRQRPPAAARPPRISIDGAIHRGFRPAGNRPPRPRPQGAARRRRCCAAGARRLVERTRRGSRPRAPTGGRSPEDVDAGWAWSARRSRRFWRGGTSPPRQGRLDAVGNAQQRFQGTNLAADLTPVQRLRGRAAEVGCTSAQRDLAWLLARTERVVPLPGTRRRSHLDDNLAALSVRLTPGQFGAVGECIPEAFGARAPDTSRLEQ
ncbi:MULTISPECIES: aldo/keto reductase [Streptomyces]|uniref:aldo/keto reductase n=1 Tax=Streptomyces TaxID=1883 RepID=UPI0022773463|nr:MULTISPECIES: aldo/keto reductase [unclassified Streptomyces]